ncbi:amino acid ABC transporter permease [Rhodanobacter sp. KK11]|jgi:glutamate/aspartate transport system permease protein|uniref:amino acid ABC transporter permease n=1 Tax=Rhodanobacter sp. KK11 TaxID=3083255 RepID=UPI002967112D|nr:amino acid ABC transporter permease [Rhodanobacter sp. KK11]MDW2980507.1 amino acid ABC transporter permease [Rhodanobacter sp. KK11]
MNYHWDWSVFRQLTINTVDRYWEWLLSGLALTVLIAMLAWVLALALGVLLGIARTVPFRPARTAVGIYVEVFRNIPLLVQLFFWYYIVPAFLPLSLQNAINAAHPVLVQTMTAVLCLGLFTAARVCEQVRAGIEAQPKDQFSAALALGLKRHQVYRYVILPMALRVIIPPLTSEFLNVFKNTAVVLTIGLLELTAQSRQVGEFTGHIFEAFIVATLLYFLVAQTVSRLMGRLERRLTIPGESGGGR